MVRVAGIVCLLVLFAGFLFADDLMELKDQSGATKFRIDPNGNVGIGTTPTQPLDLSGNMGFSGVGRRVIADFSNAVHANRLAFQTSTANSYTFASVLPSGTGTYAGWSSYSTSNPDNSSFFQTRVTDGAACSIDSRSTGSKAILPIVFQLGGVEKMRLTTDGLVGIGTSTPSAMLDVNDTIQASNNGGKVQIYNTNATTGTLNGLTDLDIRTGGVARVTVKNSGNIGIGTSAPAQKLHIYGTADLGNGIHIDAQGVTGAQQASLNLITKGDGATGLQQATTKGWHMTARGDAWATTTDRNDLSISYWDGSAWKTPFFCDSVTGNVGIGTTSPSAWGGVDPQLHIKGSYAGLVQEGSARKWQSYVSGTGYYTIADATAGANRLAIDPSGKVGIGTTSPGYLLDVVAPSQQYGQRIVGGTDSHGLLIQSGSAGTTIFNAQDSSGNSKFYVQSNGVIYMPAIPTSSGSILYLAADGSVVKATSSLRYKENVTDLELKSEKIVDLQPKSFTLKRTQERSFGLIAEEVEKVLPELVVHDAEGKPDAVRYEMLSVLLLKEYQKLLAENKNLTEKNKEIEDLKKRNDDLEARMKAIEEKLAK